MDADLVDALTLYVERHYLFAGHRGAMSFALDTIDELGRLGLLPDPSYA